jgi:hypothetical protein
MPLQKAPRGLLGLFSLKVLGQNPFGFADAVQPTFDASAMYGADLIDTALVSTAGLNNSLSQIITVPNTEVWRVRGVGMNFLTSAAFAAAASGVALSVQLVPINGVVSVPITAPFFVGAPAASLTYRAGAWLPDPPVLLGGMAIQFSADFAATAGTATASGRVWFERIPL